MIEVNAEELETSTDAITDRWSVLADPAREDEPVDASKHSGKPANGLLNTIAEEGNSFGGPMISTLRGEQIT